MRFNLLSRATSPVSDTTSGTGGAIPQSLQFTGSPEQLAIWRAIENTGEHVMVDATAGSGKSTTALRGAHGQPGASYLAFNKSVQLEIDRLNLIPARTFHSIGLEALRANFPNIKTDLKRGWQIVNSVVPPPRDDSEVGIAPSVKQLTSLAKQYGASRDLLADIIDMHEVDCCGKEEDVIKYTAECLAESFHGPIKSVDFDDMIFVPYALQLEMPKSRFLVVDELQDLNAVQQWLALSSGDRILGVGDPRQCIYKFRGADIDGMNTFRARLLAPGLRNVVSMPLTYSRRCAKSVIGAARQVVPHINYLPEAPEGSVCVLEPSSWQSAAIGDMILCRTNAPLVESGYKLLKAGRPACIIGREITQGIVNLLGRASKQCSSQANLRDILDKAADITCDEVLQFSSKKQFARANACQDRLDCLMTAAKECKTSKEVVGRLQQLTDADPRNSIRLSTIHRAKGLEADRVYLLRPELLPHPMAVSDIQRQSESNLLYVAITRARHNLVFCGSLPAGIKLPN